CQSGSWRVAMTGQVSAGSVSEHKAASGAERDRRPKFDKDCGFHADLRQRVEEFFLRTGRRKRDCPLMYVKTAVILGCVAISYGLLVFVPLTWWQALPLAVLLGLATAAVGFNIQ